MSIQRIRILSIVWFALLLCLCALRAGAAMRELYVDPLNGSDRNTGAIDAPFKTLVKAREMVRTINTDMTDDIVVNLRGGWHILTATLTFTPADSGTNGHAVIYQAYSGEYPVISGGRFITGWSVHDAKQHIWQAPAVGLNTRQLYVNCSRAQRAHKGSGFDGPCTLTENGYTISAADAGMQHWRNQNDIEFVWNGAQGAGANWMVRRCGVDGITATAVTMKQPVWKHYIGEGVLWGGVVKCGPTDIENAYALLDEPGEWYLDRPAGMLYYIPRAGEDLRTATVVAPAPEVLVAGIGTLDNPIQHLQFRGITFAHTTDMLLSGDERDPEIMVNANDAGKACRQHTTQLHSTSVYNDMSKYARTTIE